MRAGNTAVRFKLRFMHCANDEARMTVSCLRRLALSTSTCLLAALVLFAPAAWADPAADMLLELRHGWEVARYQSPAGNRGRLFAALAAKAQVAADLLPGRAEPLVWQGMALSAQAEEEGWLGVWTKYQLTHQARALFESALQADGGVLDGAAYIGLGMLYYKSPPWPLGFGSKRRAGELLQQALALHPGAIDPNFFYGEYLLETRKSDEAVAYLQKALQLPIRPGYQVTDTGRREEIRALLSQAQERQAQR